MGEVSVTLMLAGEGQFFTLHWIYDRLFAFIDIIVFDEADDYY